MEKRFGRLLILNFLVWMVFIIIASVWNGIRTKKLFESHTYLTDNLDSDSTMTSLASVLSFFLLFNYCIPMDIAVMLELNAIGYSLFLVWDAKMTYLNSAMGRIDSAKVNSLNMLENLGEVEYIMSDKTGTLT